jgi:3-hydroxy-3-methylglutaryl CoA synthase
MFSDTITITINAVAKILNRINQDGYSSEYFLRETTGEFRLKLRNSSYVDKTRGANIDRHSVELTQTVYAVAPATLTTVKKAYAVIENQQADPIVDNAKFGAGFAGFLTEANITKLLNFES